jgi:chromosome segregation ATPase
VACLSGRGAGLLPIVVMVVASVAGCERGGEASRAVLAERRASWAREIAGLKSQHEVLATRFEGRSGTGAGASASERRMRAVLDGARQSIADVESQFAQAEGRVAQAIRRSTQAGEKALEEESARARSHLQALGEQLGAVARQADDRARTDDEAK